MQPKQARSVTILNRSYPSGRHITNAEAVAGKVKAMAGVSDCRSLNSTSTVKRVLSAEVGLHLPSSQEHYAVCDLLEDAGSGMLAGWSIAPMFMQLGAWPC